MCLVMHGTDLARRQALAALVEVVSERERAAAQGDGRHRQRRALAHKHYDGERDQPQANERHRSMAFDRDPPRRATWIDDDVDGPLVHAATTPSRATARAG